MTTRRILAADDEQGYRDLYAFMLEPMGIHVTCVANGFEALTMAQEQPYDMILMDVHMPVMDGVEAFRRIRRLRPEQKFIVFSSSSDPSFVREDQALREGALTCLYKPVEMSELQRVLTETLKLGEIHHDSAQ